MRARWKDPYLNKKRPISEHASDPYLNLLRPISIFTQTHIYSDSNIWPSLNATGTFIFVYKERSVPFIYVQNLS